MIMSPIFRADYAYLDGNNRTCGLGQEVCVSFIK